MSRNTKHKAAMRESHLPVATKDIARQIAILVIRQYRRLKAGDGKKRGKKSL